VIAALFDVHGNLPALSAVLDDARGQGVEQFVLGGDYCLFGPQPEATLDRLRLIPVAVSIRGNAERWVGAPDELPEGFEAREAVLACRKALGAGLAAELAALPFELHQHERLVVHASPKSDVRSFLPEPADDEPELLAGVEARQLVFGHTHLPFRREAGGIDLVNPGSVGMPFDGDPRAAYAILHDDGRVEHRRVAYDHAGSAAMLRERFGPGGWADVVARRIERATFAV
jgi:predicted phosphodiesterase